MLLWQDWLTVKVEIDNAGWGMGKDRELSIAKHNVVKKANVLAQIIGHLGIWRVFVFVFASPIITINEVANVC